MSANTHRKADPEDIQKLIHRLNRLMNTGLQQREIAEEAGVSLSTISKMKHGDASMATYAAIETGVRRLEKALREQKKLAPESEPPSAPTELGWQAANLHRETFTLESALTYIKSLPSEVYTDLVDFLIWQRTRND